jgi:hypothetical protein
VQIFHLRYRHLELYTSLLLPTVARRMRKEGARRTRRVRLRVEVEVE